MNRLSLIVVLLALLGVGCNGSVPGETSAGSAPAPEESPATVVAPADPVYTINGSAVRIDEPGQDGTVSLLASATGDLNDDGRDDRGVILRLDSKGSGVFYYLNVFLDEGDDGWRLVGEEFLGDRVKSDFMDIDGKGSFVPGTDVPIHPDDYGQLAVGFFIHGNQPFAEPPDLYLTKHWRVDEGKLVLMENY
jgi:hypothetical protein